jgi:hypothetical protein
MCDYQRRIECYVCCQLSHTMPIRHWREVDIWLYQHSSSVLEEVDGQRDTPAVLLQGKRPLSILQEAEWGGLHDAKSLSHTGALATDRPARSDLLYRLSWPSFVFVTIMFIYPCFLDEALVGWYWQDAIQLPVPFSRYPPQLPIRLV